MPDVVITVPKPLWRIWLAEGDLAYADESGHPAGWAGGYEYGFTFGPGAPVPDIAPGERVYVVAHDRLRGYAPLTGIDRERPERFGGRPGGFALVRRGQAVAVTIDEPIRGFRGWRRRWWDRADERPFPEWQTEGVV